MACPHCNGMSVAEIVEAIAENVRTDWMSSGERKDETEQVCQIWITDFGITRVVYKHEKWPNDL